jgi:hypothetical protein
MLNASYTTPTASNNKVVSMTTNCLIVRFIEQPGGVDGFSRLVTHSLLYNKGIHRKATRIPFATLPLKDLRIYHQPFFVNVRIMETTHN